MSFSPKQARGAYRRAVQPGGALLIQERIYFAQENRHLQPDDVRDAVLLVSPSDDTSKKSVHGFRSQDALFSGLQLGSGWDVDGLGFNFQFTIPPDIFPDRGREYRAEFVLTVLGNTPGIATHELRSQYVVLGGSGLW